MITKTSLSKPIYEFLNKNKIINLIFIGFLENVPDAEVYVDNETHPTGVVARKDISAAYIQKMMISLMKFWIHYIRMAFMDSGLCTGLSLKK